MSKTNIVKTEAIVLKTFPFKDSSLIVRFFSKDLGRHSFVAKGIKKSKKQVSAVYEPFSYINLTLYIKENSDLSTLKEALLIESFYYLRESIEYIALASFFLETIDKSTFYSSENENVFNLTLYYLHHLENNKNPISWTIFCLFKLMSFLGITPNLKVCIICNKEKYSGDFYFKYSDMGFICSFCRKDKNSFPSEIYFHSEKKNIFTAVERCINGKIDEGLNIIFDSETERILIKFIISVLKYNFETDFHSEGFLNKII